MPAGLFDTLKLVVDFAALLVAVAAIVIVHLRTRSQATQAQMQEIDARLRRHADRIGTVEGELKHVPDVQVMNDLRVAVEEVRGSIKAIAVDVAGFKELSGAWARRLELIDGYLREAKR